MMGLLMGWACLAAVWAGLGAHPFLDADALFGHELLQSLAQGQGLAHWSLPPAPALFPDLGLLWLTEHLTSDLVQAQRLFGLVMALWLWLALSRLLKQLLDLPGSEARPLAGAGVLLACCLLPAGSGLARWALPGQHGTAFVAAISLWSWGLRLKHKPSTWGRSLWVGLLVACVLVSDPWLYVWGYLPLALLGLRLPRRGRIRLFSVLLGAAALAWALDLALLSTGAHRGALQWTQGFSRSGGQWGASLSQFAAQLGAHPFLLLALLAALGFWLWPLKTRHSGPRVLFVGWALAALVSVDGALLGKQADWRALYVALLLPVLLLPALVAERSPAWGMSALLAPLLGALLFLHGQAPAPPAAPAQAAWLDAQLEARGLRYGWASPSLARPLRTFSRRGTIAVPMASGQGRVDPWYWSVERSLFTQGAALERPQFVVLNGLDPGLVSAKLGMPREVLQGQGLTVWIRTQGRPARSGSEHE